MVIVSYQYISLNHASLVDSSSFLKHVEVGFHCELMFVTLMYLSSYLRLAPPCLANLMGEMQGPWTLCWTDRILIAHNSLHWHFWKKNSKHKTYTRICHNAICKRIKLWCCVLFINFLAAAPTTSVQIHWATRGHKYLEIKLVGFNHFNATEIGSSSNFR